MTLRPSFSLSRNDPGNQVEIKDMITLRPAHRAEFQAGSRCDRQIGWKGHIYKILPGCQTLNSKTPMKGHALVLDLGQNVGTRLAVGMGWGGAWVEQIH